jgi:hypothetical protein
MTENTEVESEAEWVRARGCMCMTAGGHWDSEGGGIDNTITLSL